MPPPSIRCRFAFLNEREKIGIGPSNPFVQPQSTHRFSLPWDDGGSAEGNVSHKNFNRSIPVVRLFKLA
jgi:hypothetical protein